MNVIEKIIRLFESLRFTIFLIICFLIVFILGLIVPQEEMVGPDKYIYWKELHPTVVYILELFDITDIYTAPVTIILWILFFQNLAVIMSVRIPAVWRRSVKTEPPRDIEKVKKSKNFAVVPVGDQDLIERILHKNGYRTFFENNAFLAVKNRFSPLATVLFHLSFFLILIGSVMTFYTKFRAEANIAAGETFSGQYSKLRPARIGEIPVTVFTVEEITPEYYNREIPVDLKVVLETGNGKKEISINRPYREGALSFVVMDIDVAPLFVIEDDAGSEVDGAFVKLKVLKGEEDSFNMAGYEFKTVFYTDITVDEDADKTDKQLSLPQMLQQMGKPDTSARPKEIVNPAFKIRVFRDGKHLKAGIVRKGEPLHFDGNKIYFSEIRYWANFYVGKEHGLGIVYTGFVLIIIALTIRFLFYRRDIRGMIKDGDLYVGGMGEFYSTSFEAEFEKVIDSLKSPGT
jgi:cytochrome c biogenesis protein ResB